MLKAPKDCTILQWNCRGFAPRRLDLFNLLQQNQIPVLCLCETKIPPSTRFSPYCAYNTCGKLEPLSQVTTFVHRDLPQLQLNIAVTSPCFEAVCVQVTFKKFRLSIVNMYIWNTE